MKRTLLALLGVCALLIGCTDNTPVSVPETNAVSEIETIVNPRTSGVTYVCIGMEVSARFGTCTGCRLDSSRMNSFLSGKFGYSGILLQSEQATRDTVVDSISKAVASTPENGLFILYYSGHGGQEQLSGWNTEEPEGADSADEYLCLYDTYLLDDDIWKLITPCKGRVFLIFDACHSQTMFRSIAGDIAKERGLAVPLEDKMVKSSGIRLRPRAVALEANSFKMLCWSGCLEKEYSYGSSVGGVMTNAILRRWSSGITYLGLWSLVQSDVARDQPNQHPYSTCYGSGFTEAFR